MKIAIGCDENAYDLKVVIMEHLKEKGIEYVDFGCNKNEKVLYPSIAKIVGEQIVKGNFDRGILMCGTGLGMAISANKIPGIRAATCHDPYSAERARKSNDAQIMTMGAQIIGPKLAISLVDIWLNSEFQGGRSKPKVDLINEIETSYRKCC